MATIVTRAGKGSPLTNNEVDSNFTNINDEVVAVSNLSIVEQSDVGTAPNEIPLNQYLGDLAYQDAENIAGDVGVGGDLDVAGGVVAGTLSVGGTNAPSGFGSKVLVEGGDASIANAFALKLWSSGNNDVNTIKTTGTRQLSIFNNDGADECLRVTYNRDIQAIAGNFVIGTAGKGIDFTTSGTFAVGGSEQMRLTSTGLGIGTSSPQGRLQITENSTNASVQFFTNTGGEARVGVENSAGTGILSGAGAYDTAIRTTSGTGISFGIGYSPPAMRLDSSGNLGLGVTPSAWFSNAKAIDIKTFGSVYSENSYYGAIGMSSNATWTGGALTDWVYKNTGTATRYEQHGAAGVGAHAWYTAPSGTAGNAISFTQAMTLDASGNLLVGTTSVAGSANNKIAIQNTGQTDYGLTISNSNDQTNDAIGFFNNSGTRVGVIQFTTTTTSYVTSSDYRLKENIAPMTGALDTVAQLNPVTYSWKADGSDGQGFIAHELQAVVPDAVTGDKDAVDDEGNPQYQGVDTSFLVATLTKAIQELSAKVAELEAKVNA